MNAATKLIQIWKLFDALSHRKHMGTIELEMQSALYYHNNQKV